MSPGYLPISKTGCRNLLNDFSLFPSRVDSACDADQTGGDGDSDAYNRKPFTFRNLQIGVPYRIDETQPCDESGRDRDPKCLDFCKARGQPHSESLRALCVEMVAAKFRRPGRGLFPCQAKRRDRSHSAVCNDLEKLKGGFGQTYRKSLQQSGNTSVLTVHFRDHYPGRFNWLSRQGGLDRNGCLRENFSLRWKLEGAYFNKIGGFFHFSGFALVYTCKPDR
jgi:hypothetical protein